MPTIGIITFHRQGYGAILQAYALVQKLNQLGFNPEIIDYLDQSLWRNYSSVARRFKHAAWYHLKNIIAGTTSQRRTEDFCRKYLHLSSAPYRDTKILHSDPPLFDIYLTGSDQVWNPNISSDPAYFLSFAPVGKKLIAYGASFGVSRINRRQVDAYSDWLKRIDSISVREFEGKQIVKQLTGRDVQIVLDPTLLLEQEQWRQISSPYEFSHPYILCYYVPGDKQVNKGITQMASRVSSLTGWKIICIGQKEYMRFNFMRHSIFDAGPAEFLGLFQNAACIITNSYHGCAFSINYRKPFYALINKDLNPEKSANSRITTLIKMLKLDDRLLSAQNVSAGKIDLHPDYQLAESILQNEKQRSVDFLKNALGAP